MVTSGLRAAWGGISWPVIHGQHRPGAASRRVRAGYRAVVSRDILPSRARSAGLMNATSACSLSARSMGLTCWFYF